jgi:hypothetical protein
VAPLQAPLESTSSVKNLAKSPGGESKLVHRRDLPGRGSLEIKSHNLQYKVGKACIRV